MVATRPELHDHLDHVQDRTGTHGSDSLEGTHPREADEVTDFQFDQVQAKAALGQLQRSTIDTNSDCPDLNGDGEVGVDEVLAVIAAWNTNNADVNNDGIVNTDDPLLVLS
jgi:hypothetical protein